MNFDRKFSLLDFMEQMSTEDGEKAVIYTRYSSSAQRDASIEQQIRACQEYARQHGLKIVEIYEDRALTGTNDKRPGFQRMIRDSANRQWKYVLVYSLDRFARDRYDSAKNKHELKQNGVRVLSVTEHLTDDPTGILMESILEGYAEYYSRELAQKTKRGMADNASRCMVNGPVPVGYERGADGRYAIYEPDAAVIREACRRVLDGETITSVANDLQRRGLQTRKGRPWTREMLYHALGNERYAGVYLYGDVRIEGGIPAVISRQEFDALTSLLGSKANPRKKPGEPSRRRTENGMYLLTGKIYCGNCGNPMVGVSGRGKCGVMYYYYACKGQRTKTCQTMPLRRDWIEWEVANAIKTYVLNDEAIQGMADALIQHQLEQSDALELQSLRDRLTETNRSLGNILAAIEKGVFVPTIQQRLMELENDKSLLSAKISILEKKVSDLPSKDDITALLYLYQQGELNDKNYQQAIIDAFLRAVYVYDDHLDLVITTGDKSDRIKLPTKNDLDSALSPSEGLYKPENRSPLVTIQTKHAEIAFFNGVFAVRCRMVRLKNHT